MFHTKKYFLVIIIILCICSIHTIAQTDFYYYKGEKIPLKENENKVCLSIPKDKDTLFEIIQANVKVQDKLNDDIFDVLIIDCQYVEMLSSMDCWEKFSNNVLLTPCYNTANDQELYSTPYLNVRLKKESDLPLLESYAKRYGLKIVRQDPLMPLWYILSITDYHEINTLEGSRSVRHDRRRSRDLLRQGQGDPDRPDARQTDHDRRYHLRRDRYRRLRRSARLFLRLCKRRALAGELLLLERHQRLIGTTETRRERIQPPPLFYSDYPKEIIQ